MNRWAVVLAGGVGSRFWPISTPARPKQLLPLATEEPLLSDALVAPRAAGAAGAHADPHERAAGRADRRARAVDPARELHRRAAACGHRGGARVGGARDRAPRRTRRGDDQRARRLGRGRSGRIPRGAVARRGRRRAASCARDRRRRAGASRSGIRLHPAGRRGERRRSPRGAVRREAGSRARRSRWCATAISGTRGSSSGARAIFSTRSRRTRRKSRRTSPRTATTSRAFFGAVTTPISVDVGVLERSAKVLVLSGRLRVGRRGHVGGAAPRARVRRAGQRAARHRARGGRARQRRARRRAPRSCSTASPISSSCRATGSRS